MDYSEFPLADVKSRLGLTVIENVSPFGNSDIPKVEISDYLRRTLDEFGLLAEVRRQLLPHASLFSGVTFNVDASRGLEGICDYLLSRSPEQYYVSTPVVAVIEAKKEDIVGGLGQCLATMYAASVFNAREGNAPDTLYGAVTTGSAWRFLRLEGITAWIDRDEQYIQDAERLVGLLRFAVAGSPPASRS